MRANPMDKTKYLSQKELELVKSKLNPHKAEHIAIMLLINSGARASEVLNLDQASINHEAHSIFIKGLKGSHNREIPLNDSTWNTLQRYLDLNTGNKLFTFTLRWLQLTWNKLMPFKSIKSTRHTFAINLYKSCRDIKLVQKALGHKSITNTMVYMDYVYTTEELKNALKGL